MKLKFSLDWFIIALVGVLILAYLFPNIGTITKPVDIQKLTGYGITIIFFFYGLKLSPKKFTQGLGNWKMHVIIQLATFILFPILLICLKPFFTNSNIWLSLFFVAALPSTVSSSVVMVSLAKGNVPSAIFNATISSFGGIFITPLWMGIFMVTNNINVDSSEIVLKLVFQILVPIIAGSLLNKKLGTFAEKHSKSLKIFDQSIVLLIVYTSFCKSFKSGVFETISITQLAAILLGMAALFFAVFYILRYISKLLHFNYPDSVTVLFCGSKKSLIHGVVISKVLFSGTALAGFILVPIMMYHSIQLIIIGFMVQKMGKIISV